MISDAPDIIDKTKDLAGQESQLCAPHLFMLQLVHKIYNFHEFCLSLSGSAIWSLACPQLKSLEVTFNNILRKIWELPRWCHTSLLHLTAALDSVFNVVCDRSLRLVNSAINSNSNILYVFYQSSKLVNCFAGHNCVYGWKHRKLYTEQDTIFASFM